MNDIARLIREVPNFPQMGIVFRDITPLLLEPRALRRVIDFLAQAYSDHGITKVVGIESRGFILGVPVALALGCGFVPVRKLGKLPRATASREYALEYGVNHLEMHVDAIDAGDRVLVIDDVLATGGTARAAIEIAEDLGGSVAGVAFLLEIAALGGRGALGGRDVLALLTY